MAFVTVSTGQIAVGEPVKNELLTKIKDNEDDLDGRTASLEASASRIVVLQDIVVNSGQYSSSATIEELVLFVAPSDFNLITAEVTVFEDSASGTLEIDLLRSTTGFAGAFSTVFSTKPSVAAGSGNDTTSVNTVFSTTAISEGDILRVDITSLMTSPSQRRFFINILGEPS